MSKKVKYREYLIYNPQTNRLVIAGIKVDKLSYSGWAFVLRTHGIEVIGEL